jgi:tetratricopeptide (TPR) repeat protein
MRHFQFQILTVPTIAASLAVFLASPLPALAQTEAAKPAAGSLAEAADPLDSLFSELKRERDTNQAKRISERIWARWRDSGSATTNLLLQWADKAMVDKKNSLALDLLDQVVVLMPDFAEGWNRRATLHYAMGNHSKSMADINRVLALEPRHFGAMAGMAAILDASGNDALALRAWEQMLEVYPANRQAQTKVGELADKLAGSKT